MPPAAPPPPAAEPAPSQGADEDAPPDQATAFDGSAQSALRALQGVQDALLAALRMAFNNRRRAALSARLCPPPVRPVSSPHGPHP